MAITTESRGAALARLYDLDVSEDPGDLDLYRALADRTGGAIVELAVGTGRVAVPLTHGGHDVVGIDRDPAMLARARSRATSSGREGGVGGAGAGRDGRRAAAGLLELVEADVLAPRSADLGRHRLAILALNSLLLFADRSLQERVVATMARLVAPGGLVVIDAWQPQPFDLVRLDGRLSLEWVREDPETGREVTKIASGWYDVATRVVTLTTLFDEAEPGGPLRRWTRTDRMRLAAADELQGWAEAAGLEVEQLGGDYELAPYASGSERVVLVARRPPNDP